MIKQSLHKISLIVFILFCSITQAFSGGAKVGASVDNTHIVAGEPVSLSVTVSGMSSSNSSCEYSITIPEGLLNSDETEIEVNPITNKLTEVGSAGNGTYDHGSYTSKKPGKYTFDLKVTTGEKEGENPVVYFHPGDPSNLTISDITPLGFTATWTEGTAAESYTIILERAGLEPIEITGIAAPPYQVTGLNPESEYICKVKTIANGLSSLKPSNSVFVTTPIRPVLFTEGEIKAFDLTLKEGASSSQKLTINGANLQEDISLSLKSGNSFYSIDKTVITAESKETVTLTFSPDKAGTFTDTLMISSLHAEPINIPLTGKVSLSTPSPGTPTELTSTSFTANWKAIPFAEEYRISVFDPSKSTVRQYNGFSTGQETSCKVSGLYPNTKYTYTVYAYNNGILGSTSSSKSVTTTDGPAIVYNQLDTFATTANTPVSKTIRIHGIDLSQAISAELNPQKEFSINKTEVDANGGSILVTYTPTAMDSHQATLTLRSAEEAEAIITLEGHGLPEATKTTAAGEVTDQSFAANWEAQEQATDYLLTVKQGEKIVVDRRSSENANTLIVDNLTAGQTYTYTVEVVENGLISPASNSTSVTTHAAPQPTAHPGKTDIRVIWTIVTGADKYKAYLYKDDTVIESYNGVETTETMFIFSDLEATTEYAYEIKAVFGDKEYSSGKATARTGGGYYGAQIENLGFELWDNPGTKEEEPAHWNSFMNAAGKQAEGSFGGFVKVQKVKVSDMVRPQSAGEQSAVIWSTSTAGIVANGNLTTGRIMANSMTPADYSNHNKTLPDDDQFNAPFNGKADSLTVWVRFVPGNPSDTARVAAAIHDNYPYQDPNNETEIEQHAFAKAECNYKAAEDNAWQRITMPFKRTGYDANPEFMLVSFTTNKTPGKGSENDSVYIDDMLVVYTPSVSITTDDINGYLLGATINVPFNLTGTMSPYNLNAEPNIVYLELSDSQGSFENARRIGQITTDYSGTLSAKLPDDLEIGTQYRIRIVTTNYPMISEPSAPFSILAALPNAPIAQEASDITKGSFTANWVAVDGATGYIVVIAGKDYIVENGETTSLEINGLNPETEYSYVVKTAIGSLISEASNEIKVKTEVGGLIAYTGTTDFTTTNNVSVKNTLAIQAAGLISSISTTIADDENGYFKLSTATLGQLGGNVTVTYQPKALGVHTATLVLASPFTDSVKINISGKAIPKTIKTLPAENITPIAFTAYWEAGSDAEAYLLTIQNQAGETVSGYDNLNVGDTTAYTVTGLSPDTEYNYTVIASAQGLESAVSNQTAVKTLIKPLILAEIDKTDFVQDINTSDAANVTVSTEHLISNIVSTSLTGSKHFNLQLNSDEEMTINYEPTQAGKDTAVLKINTPHADPVIITLTGIARPLATVALASSSSTYDSFVATWEASTSADSYLLTVKDDRDRIVEGYDQKNVGNVTEAEVNGLKRLKDYTYYVEVFKNDVASLPSNTIEVRTVPNQSGLSQTAAGNIKLYPNPAKDYLFVTGLPADQEYTIIDTKGMIMMSGKAQGNKIGIENLPANTYILNIANMNLPFIKE